MRRTPAPRTAATGRPHDPRRIDGRRFSHATNAAMRFLAVQEVAEGAKPSAVMRRYGLCRTSIYRWLRAARRQGAGALAPRRHPGRPPTLGEEDAARVRGWLIGRTPGDHGLPGAFWTRPLVGRLVCERLGATLGPTAVGRLLRRVGLDPRARPERGKGVGTVPEGLVFAVDGRGRFLCERSPAGGEAWQRAVRRLRARTEGSLGVTFRFLGPVSRGPAPTRVRNL